MSQSPPVKAEANFTAGGILSRKRFTVGYYEARFKLPRKSGWHSSFFTKYGILNPEDRALGSDLEFDICEQTSFNKTAYTTNVHRWRLNQERSHIAFANSYASSAVETGTTLSDRFHIWGAEISATDVRYFFDGKLVKIINIKKDPDGNQVWLNQQNIWLTSLAMLEHFDDNVDMSPASAEDATLLDTYEIDWIRYYRQKTP